jgi:hypothetical protein
MSHNTDTQRPLPMPRQSGLLRRHGRYYFNIRIPSELRPLYGRKEFVRKALNTSDYYKAASEARFEAARVQAEFEAKRRKIKFAPSTKLQHLSYPN